MSLSTTHDSSASMLRSELDYRQPCVDAPEEDKKGRFEKANVPPPENRQATAGETIFNRVTYTGIGFGVNEGLSLWITDEFEHGKAKPLFERLSTMLVEKFPNYFKDVYEHGKLKTTARQSAGNLLMTMGLLTGGTLLVWPMKILEDYKTQIVTWINHQRDGKDLTPEQIKARDDEVAHAIACEPKQSWTSLLLGRALAVSSTIGFGTLIMGTARNNKVKQKTEKVSVDTLKSMNRSITGSEHGALSSLADDPKFRRYAGLAGVETIYCAISSVVLEIASKFFARKNPEVKDPALCPPEARPSEDSPEKPGSLLIRSDDPLKEIQTPQKAMGRFEKKTLTSRFKPKDMEELRNLPGGRFSSKVAQISASTEPAMDMQR